MFGLFKPKMAPTDPAEIVAVTEIARPAADIYAMIDFASPQHWKAEVGTITRTGANSYALELDLLPGVSFPIIELEAEPHRSYAIESVLPEGTGRLLKTVERTTITPLDADRCEVTLATTATFKPMRARHFEQEILQIATACQVSLAKLKIHAEQGVDAIREIEARQVA